MRDKLYCAIVIIWVVLACPAFGWDLCGDVDNNGEAASIGDVTYLVSWFFMGGQPPTSMWAANVDGQCEVSLRDVRYLTRYIYEGGDPLSCAEPQVCHYPVNGAVSLDHVGGSVDGRARLGLPITFHIRMACPGAVVWGGYNGFRVYGASDAGGTYDGTVDFTPITFDTALYLMSLPASLGYGTGWGWSDAFKFMPYGVDGMGADTIGFLGSANNITRGLPASFSEVVYTITTTVTDLDDLDKYICLDSAWFPQVGRWQWEQWNGGFTPSWDGPHCFEIGPEVICGDVNGNDIGPDASDLVYLINWLTKGGSEPPTRWSANVDGQCGVDMRDVIYLEKFMFQGGDPLMCAEPEVCDYADYGAVTVDHVAGLADGLARPGLPVTFNIRFTCPDDTVWGGHNGFRVYGASDASGTFDPSVDFNPITYDTALCLRPISPALGYGSDWGWSVVNRPFGVDGIGADTIGFVGWTDGPVNGLPPSFDEVTFLVSTAPADPADEGKYICIDSCWFPPVHRWQWEQWIGGFTPSWDGPHCVQIGPELLCGDVDGNAIGPNIADLTYLVGYLFAGGPEPPSVWSANVDGCNGVNVLDVYWLTGFMFRGGPDLSCDEPTGCTITEAGSIALDHVDGLTGGKVLIGDEVTFNLRMTNLGSNLYAAANGFRVYGASDASGTPDPSVRFDPVVGDSTRPPIGYGWDGGLYIAAFQGASADTIGFAGLSQADSIVPFFDDVVYSLTTRVTDYDHVCKYLCIDSAWYPPAGDWLWGNADGAHRPSWDGPHCFLISQKLEGDFRAYPARGSAPLTVMFDEAIETVVDSRTWFFGDGDSSNLKYPIHTYVSDGVYDVKLVLRFDAKQCGATTDSIVKPGYVVVTDLEARFGATPVAGEVPLTVSFTDSSVGSPDSWWWDFGDGETSPLQNPSHQYEDPGAYDVTLIVGSSGGPADTLLRPGLIHVADTLYPEVECDIRLNPFSAQPGAETRYWLFWANRGTGQAESCSLRVLLPPELQSWTLLDAEGSPVSYSTSDDTLIMSLGVIPPDHVWRYVVAEGTLAGSLSAGDTLKTESWIGCSPPDSNLIDNYCLHLQEILDLGGKAQFSEWKIASPNGTPNIWQVEAEDVLNYWIMYINPGPDDATYIRVSDTLDPNLNRGTFEVLEMPGACSHDFDARSGVVSFNCDDVFLGAGDTAFFSYAVQVKANRLFGTTIPNSGWIGVDNNGFSEIGPVIRVVGTCCLYEGDIDLSGYGPDIADLVYLVNWMFKEGPIPPCWDTANIDQEGESVPDIADLVFLVDFMFKNGAPPPPCPSGE